MATATPTTAVLLHGLGATSAVWTDVATSLVDRGWAVVTPDLPGHGTAEDLADYTLDALAAAISRSLPRTDQVAVLGHSLGGAVALRLASGRFGIHPARTVGLGIKVDWPPEDVERARAMAARPPRTLPDREAAIQWAAKLAGIADPDALAGFADTAVRGLADGSWTARWDPRSAAVHSPPVARDLAAARGEVVLARGERDHMCSSAEYTALHPSAVDIPAAGHNAHLEQPGLVAALLVDRAPANQFISG